MEEIKTEEEFKKQLMRCTKYMTSVGNTDNVEMDIPYEGKVITIMLSLKVK